MNNTCVCCGEIIPEGRQICPKCERKSKDRKTDKSALKPLMFGMFASALTDGGYVKIGGKEND